MKDNNQEKKKKKKKRRGLFSRIFRKKQKGGQAQGVANTKTIPPKSKRQLRKKLFNFLKPVAKQSFGIFAKQLNNSVNGKKAIKQ